METSTYIIKSDVSDLYKIGHTKNIEKRLKQIKGVLSFVNLEIVHLIPYNCEKALHLCFSRKREIGEWFSLSENDIEEIKTGKWKKPIPLNIFDYVKMRMPEIPDNEIECLKQYEFSIGKS